MNIRDMTYLVNVAKYRHFGKAAEASFISQPTLSMQIKKLEETLGVSLFERHKKQVHVTAVGKDVVARAEAILQAVAEMKALANAAKDPLAGVVKLALIPTIAPYLLPKIMPQITQEMPDLLVQLLELKTHQIIEALEKGEIDMAILALPIAADGLRHYPLYNEDFFVALPETHPKAQEKAIKLELLKHENILLLDEGHCLRDQALDVCHQVGAENDTSFRATSLETLRQIVASGGGVTLMPKLAKRDDDHLVYLPFQDALPFRQIVLAQRHSSPRMKVAEKIAEIIAKVV